MEKIGIVILNYKVKDDVLACIKSLQKSSYKNYQMIVVDNNSEDGLADEIKNFPEIKFIQNNNNLGYTGGNNIGIKAALEIGADFVFILNPDTLVDSDCLKSLLEAAKILNAQIVGPKIYFPDNKTIWFAGGIIDTNNIIGVHQGVDEKDLGQYDKVEETDFVTGAAMFVKSNTFEKIGFFDDRYFLYLEDLEFCFRAKLKGMKILYDPRAKVIHKNAHSTGLGSSLQDYYITRNRLLFAFKYLSWQKRLALLRHILFTLNFSTRRQALFDFMLGNTGKGTFK